MTKDAAQHDHPHLRGEDEVFQFLHAWTVNVDLAHRLLAAGEISARDYAMPPRDAGRKLLGLPDELFGIAARDGSYEAARQILGNMGARTFVDVDRLASIPPTVMERPALMVMWDTKGADEASARMRRAKPDVLQGKTFPSLVDGNHRLAKAFLDGREEPLPCPVVTEWKDLERFLSYLGKPLVKPPARKKAAAAAPPGPRR